MNLFIECLREPRTDNHLISAICLEQNTVEFWFLQSV